MTGVNVCVNPPPVMATAEVPSVPILTRTHLWMSWAVSTRNRLR